MGSGKTAIGRLLAQAVQLPFRDSDHEIEIAAGMSIPEIFEEFGEDYFRQGEHRVIERVLGEGSSVISLGGGAFVNPHTRASIESRAVSIWLDADIDLLMDRVMRRPDTRPLLQTEDPRGTLANLLEKRLPIYQLANLRVTSSGQSKNQMLAKVLGELEKWLDSEPESEITGKSDADGQGRSR